MTRSLLALALLALAAPLGAQQGASATPPSTSAVIMQPARCLDSIPPSAMTPLPVFVVPVLRDTTQRFFLQQVGTLAQALVDRTRVMLGAPGDSLPRGEPVVTWRGLHRSLSVAWNRDGAARWWITPDSIGSDPAPPLPGTTEAAALLARALEGARTAGTAALFWPEGPAPDSVVFDLTLQSPLVDDTNGVQPIRAEIAVPMMVVQTPRIHAVRGIHMRAPSYPTGPLMGSATGRVILQFVVDTTGRADMSTLRDMWPSDKPRLEGKLGDYYASFVRAARSSIQKATFDPARIGGCKVRQVVQQPFTYSFP